MFNEEKRLAKEAEKIAEKLKKKPNNARLLKQAETIAQKQAEQAIRLAEIEKTNAKRAAKTAENKIKIAENKAAIAEIDAHNKRVLQETFSEIKEIRQEGKQRRTQMVTDSINEGRARRGEALIGEQQPAINPAQTDVASELRKFQQLADEGLISAEEFESKRKQLLGI